MRLKLIPGYSRYAATEDAIIWDMKNDREVSQVLTGEPRYKYVNLWNDDGKRVLRRVHHLVALTYIPNPDNLPLVDHKDRDRMNNRVTNLRWASIGQNQANRTDNIVPGGLRQWVRQRLIDGLTFDATLAGVYRRINKGMVPEEALAEYITMKTQSRPVEKQPS